MTIRDRVCVVTGGASGIGAAMCRRFAAEGAAHVAVLDLDAEGADGVAGALTEAGHAASAHSLDVADAAAVAATMAEIVAAAGRIDVLCNNAGIATGSDPLSTEIDVWDQQWQVNVMAHVHALRAVLPAMRARGDGRLLFTASMAGILSTHGNAVYATTKHAVVGLAEWVAFTYRDEGIRTHLLAPLGVNTPMLATDTEWARLAAGPVKEPEDVAGMVVDAFEAERFLIVTDPIAEEWMAGKAADLDRWLGGMAKLQRQIVAAGDLGATERPGPG